MTLDMPTRIRPADWCAAARSLPAARKPVRLDWQLALSSQQEQTCLVNMRINRGLREMLHVMFSDECDRSKDL